MLIGYLTHRAFITPPLCAHTTLDTGDIPVSNSSYTEMAVMRHTWDQSGQSFTTELSPDNHLIALNLNSSSITGTDTVKG